MMQFRVGFGYDVHQLTHNRKLVLGGVTIPFERGLLGHSDADVLCHAICDALLGAAAMGDIGMHFPDTDPEYKNISSLKLLTYCIDKIQSKHYKVGNIDSTIIAQAPRMAPYILDMRNNLQDVMAINMDQINIKATTTEKLGFIGTGAGIASHCAALIYADPFEKKIP